MEDNLRYLFSAVFQGFAAIIAIGAIFVIFKLQDANSTKNKRFELLITATQKLGKEQGIFSDLLEAKRWKQFNDHVTRIADINKLINEFYKELYDFHSKFRDVNKMNPTQKSFYMLNVNKNLETWTIRIQRFFKEYNNYKNVENRLNSVIEIIKIPTILCAFLMITSLIFLILIGILSNYLLYIYAILELLLIVFTLYILWRAIQKILAFSEE